MNDTDEENWHSGNLRVRLDWIHEKKHRRSHGTDENWKKKPMLDQNSQKNEMEISDENRIGTGRKMGSESSWMEPWTRHEVQNLVNDGEQWKMKYAKTGAERSVDNVLRRENTARSNETCTLPKWTAWSWMTKWPTSHRSGRKEDTPNFVENINNEWIKKAKDQKVGRKEKNKFAITAAAPPHRGHQWRSKDIDWVCAWHEMMQSGRSMILNFVMNCQSCTKDIWVRHLLRIWWSREDSRSWTPQRISAVYEGGTDELMSLPHFSFLLFKVYCRVVQNLRIHHGVRIQLNLSQQ